MKLRLAFMGTPAFALPALEALLKAGHEIACVYTQPPRPRGRGQAIVPAAVERAARARNLPIRTPETLRNAAEQDHFAALALDAAVVVAYGLILPKPVLEAPKLGCFNIHASLLPRWRGAAPIQRALLAGDEETGISIMKMDEGLDTGPVLLAERIPIAPRETFGTLHDALAALGARLVVAALEGMASGALAPKPQREEGVTYAAKLRLAEARLDWTKPARALERAVRAFAPSPGAWCEMAGERVKILDAVLDSRAGAPGEILPGGLAVACGEGALKIVRLQRAGRVPQLASDFLRGFRLEPGERLA